MKKKRKKRKNADLDPDGLNPTFSSPEPFMSFGKRGLGTEILDK